MKCFGGLESVGDNFTHIWARTDRRQEETDTHIASKDSYKHGTCRLNASAATLRVSGVFA